MRLAERLRAYPWIIAACVGALVGAVIGLFLPIRAAAPPKADETVWSLPTPASIKRFDESKYQALRGARFWAASNPRGQRGAQATSWNLNAIVTRPTTRIAVTNAGKQEVTWVPLGGNLPDGGRVVAASRDTVWFERDGCRRARTLYQKPTADSDACIDGRKADPAASPAPADQPAATPAQPRAPL